MIYLFRYISLGELETELNQIQKETKQVLVSYLVSDNKKKIAEHAITTISKRKQHAVRDAVYSSDDQGRIKRKNANNIIKAYENYCDNLLDTMIDRK